VEIALGLKTTPGEGVASTGAPIATAPDLTSALEAQIVHELAGKQEEQRTRKRLGLKPNAEVSEVQEMKRLVTQIERDSERLLKNPMDISNIAKQSDGTYTVLHRSYKLETPEALRQFQDSWDTTQIFLFCTHGVSCIFGTIMGLGAASFLIDSTYPVVTLCTTGLAIGLAVVAVGAKSLSTRYPAFCHNKYIGGSLRSKEPGSLGAVVDSFHKARLDCDIRVGAWDRKEMRVDLRVSYTPKKHA
jgi:hypothetical protein